MSETFKNVRYALLSMLLFVATAVSAQTISGNVKDGNGEPIIGATVMEQGTQNGTVTDFDGNFTLKLKKGGNLNVSYVGMKPQVVKTAGKSSVNVQLEDDNTTLNDLVVVGYGTMKKSDLTGSVSSVNTEQLNAKGQPDVLGNLQGSTPGVNITTAGRPGESASIEIRGKSSINSDVTPLFVVDGVMCDDIDWLNPQDIEKIDVLKDASSTAIYGSRATAGVVMVTTKGGSHVSKDKKATISYDGYIGWQTTARMPEYQNAQQFYDYRFMKFLGYANSATAGANPAYAMTPSALEQCLLSQHSGVAGTTDQYVLKNMLASGNTTDWPSLVTQNGIQQNHYLAVSGGSSAVSYHMGVGYNGVDGVYKDDKTQKYTFKGSLDAKVTDWLNAGFNINFSEQTNKYANDDAMTSAFRMNPFMSAVDSDGNNIHQPGINTSLGTDGNQFTSQRNPLDLMLSSTKKRHTWRLLGNVYLEFKPVKGLSYKMTFSPNYNHYNEGYFDGHINPVTGKFYDDEKKTSNYAYYTSNEGFSWTWDNIVNYSTKFNDKHSLNLMGLYSAQKSTTEYNRSTSYGVTDGTLWYNLPSGTYAAYNSGSSDAWFKNGSRNYYSENRMSSIAFRANYGYLDRYLATFTIRWDGSSKFTEGNRWGSFPSFALAWRVTEEPWMKKAEWLSNLKVRLSYGVTGNNSGIDNYNLYSITEGGSYYYNGEVVNGKKLASIIDQNLKWEKSYEWNLGFDYGFLNNRINGSIDFYSKKSEDLLYSRVLPLSGASVYTNVGQVSNKGIEFSINGLLYKTKDWTWNMGLTFATNKNEVKQINGDSDIIDNGVTGSLKVGESVNSVYTYVCDGIVSDRFMGLSDAQLALYNAVGGDASKINNGQIREYDYYYAVYGWREGQPIINDGNMDGVIDGNDRQFMSSDPACTIGWNTNVTWKNWDFSMSIYSKLGGKAYNANLEQYLDYSDRGRNRINVDYYIPAGTLLDCDGYNADGTLINPVYQTETHYGEYPFPNNGGDGSGVGPNYSQYTEAAAVSNTSFMKIKNITLGYTFPKEWLKPWGCQHLRLYFTVTNPVCITGYKGFDPEWASASIKKDCPSTVTYQVGASIKF